MTGELTNDFAIKLATVNGTGSASANSLLMQAIFRMGIPVSGKNVFPSNIQGLPTWYEIRVSHEGYTARRNEYEIVVAMNPQTYVRDVAEVKSAGFLLHDSSWPLPEAALRGDIDYLGVPFATLCVENFDGDRERILMKNIAYVGAMAALIDLDLDVVREMLHERFGNKDKLIGSNLRAIELGYSYARENFDCPIPARLEPLDRTSEAIMIDGNTAAALGCVFAGATVGAWYPITPATSLMDAFSRFCGRYRTAASGEKNFCIVQAEDELAAAGIVIGANWMGARAFTPTSGPGISLMSEFIGLAYYAEIPAVFFDVQRTGPSTGMPTRTQQGDILSTVFASHGDTRHIVLFPAHPKECFDFAVAAFDHAERYQTPVFVLSDLDIAMNDWMSERFEWSDEYQPDRGKVLTASELEEMEHYFRYFSDDDSEICARTLPGTHPRGAYFTRGSGHDKYGRYTEDASGYTEVVDRIERKIRGSANDLPEPIVDLGETMEMGIIGFGSCSAAIREAIDVLRASGVSVSYCRIRAYPFSDSVLEFVTGHDRIVVVEQNRDAQMRSLLVLEVPERADRISSVRRYGGMPLSANELLDAISQKVGLAV